MHEVSKKTMRSVKFNFEFRSRSRSNGSGSKPEARNQQPGKKKKPAKGSQQRAAETPAKRPAGELAEKAAKRPAGKKKEPAKGSQQRAAEKPAKRPAGELAEKPAKRPAGELARKPAKRQAGELPAELPPAGALPPELPSAGELLAELPIFIAIRSSGRPGLALRTLLMLRKLFSEGGSGQVPLAVFVQETELAVYREQFGELADSILTGAQGSGEQVRAAALWCHSQISNGTGAISLILFVFLVFSALTLPNLLPQSHQLNSSWWPADF